MIFNTEEERQAYLKSIPEEIRLMKKVLIARAMKAGYKDKIPFYPKNPNHSVLVGYWSRMSNWRMKLEHRERMIALDESAALVSEKAKANAQYARSRTITGLGN